MITLGLLVVITLLVVYWVAKRLRNPRTRVRTLNDLAVQSRPVDVEAFRNLIDPGEESYLRSHLSGHEFRCLQRSRMLAAINYVRCTAHNARLLLELADAGRSSSDPEIAAAAIRLANTALKLRVYSLLAMFTFGLRVVVPSLPLRSSSITAKYTAARDCVAGFTRIQEPASVARFEAAL